MFFEYLLHFSHGLLLLFLGVMTFYLNRKKKGSRLLTFLFWETVFWLFIHLKDIDYLVKNQWDSIYLLGIKICMDTWCIPVTLFLLMEITQSRRLTQKMITLLMLPTILLTAGYVVSSSMMLCNILLGYNVLYGLFMALAYRMASRKNDNFMTRYFDNTGYMSNEWVKMIIPLLFVMLAVWVIIIATSSILSNSLFYIYQIFVWSYLYVYAMKHIEVGVSRMDNINSFQPEIENQKEIAVFEETDKLVLCDSYKVKLQQCMEEDRMYLNPKLTISDVAVAIGTNRTYLSDYFNKTLGVNFFDYVNKYRVAAACNILADGNFKKMEEVAEMSGFNSLSTFHRSFQKVMEMTPKQYRKSAS